MQLHPFDGIILSTLPTGLSRWILMDLSHRFEREFRVPVEWIESRTDDPDEATTITSDKMLMVGNLHVSAGSVTLWTLASEKGPWKAIINKETGQWGTAYKAENDLGRLDIKVEALETAVEQFTIAIEPVGNAGQIVMTWDKTKMVIPFSVM